MSDLAFCIAKLCGVEYDAIVSDPNFEGLYEAGSMYMSWRSALRLMLVRHWQIRPLYLSDEFSLADGNDAFEVPVLMQPQEHWALIRGVRHKHDWALWQPPRPRIELPYAPVSVDERPAALWHCGEQINLAEYPFTAWCPVTTIGDFE